jgi:hypothetical protein
MIAGLRLNPSGFFEIQVVHQTLDEKKNPLGFFDLLHPVRMKQRKFGKNFLLSNVIERFPGYFRATALKNV